jgi:hypothetical protein
MFNIIIHFHRPMGLIKCACFVFITTAKVADLFITL